MLPISIVIATYNRCEELQSTLNLLIGREPVAEIIIVDNNSSDTTTKMIRKRFSRCKLIVLSTNIGVSAFGVGVCHATQPFVFLLDDDAVPEHGTLSQVVKIFSEHPEFAVIACCIIDQNGTLITKNWPRYPLCFWGCGAALRKNALSNQPYLFDPRLFLYGSEMDLAIRLYKEGHTIFYAANAIVMHRFSRVNRSEGCRMYFLVQAALWFPLKHLPFRLSLIAITRHLLRLLYKALKSKCLPKYLAGLVDGLREIPSVLRERKPILNYVAQTYYENVWEYEPFYFQLLRAVLGLPQSRRDVPKGFSEAHLLSMDQK